MDLKKIYEGGEPNICMPDIMFTQYSNHFGLQGLAKSLDYNNNGITLYGCELSSTFEYVSRQAKVNITDGYIVIDGELIKVSNTPELTFTVSFVGPGRTIYIYATKDVTYNPLGTKTFNNNVSRETWEETRIKLEYNTTGGRVYGSRIIGSFYYQSSNNTVTGISLIKNSFQEGIIKYVVPDMVTTNRKSNSTNDDKDRTIVTPDKIYDILGNETLLELTSVSQSVEPSYGYYYYIFNVPTTVKKLNLISCSTTIVAQPNRHIASGRPNELEEHWLYDTDLDVLLVYFPVKYSLKPLNTTAKAMLLVNYIS